MRRPFTNFATALVSVSLLLAVNACSSDEKTPASATASAAASVPASTTVPSDASSSAVGTPSAPAAAAGKLVIYSGRNEKLIGDLIKTFEATGVDVDVRYAGTSELAAQILEEGDNSPADVFFSQDAGALGALSKAGRLQPLTGPTVTKVGEQYRAADASWVGVSGRARVLAYNPTKVPVAELPASVLDLTDPKWKGRIGFAPTNASFQSFVTALRVKEGEAKAKEWLTGLKANGAKAYEGNGQVLDAVDKGEVHVGLVNHYYLYEKAAEVGADKVVAKNHFFSGGDAGALVNVAGVGVIKGAKNAAAAQQFAEFLLSAPSQKYFAEKTYEYPLIGDAAPRPDLPALRSIQGPDVNLADLDTLQATLTLLQEVGLV